MISLSRSRKIVSMLRAGAVDHVKQSGGRVKMLSAIKEEASFRKSSRSSSLKKRPSSNARRVVTDDTFLESENERVKRAGSRRTTKATVAPDELLKPLERRPSQQSRRALPRPKSDISLGGRKGSGSLRRRQKVGQASTEATLKRTKSQAQRFEARRGAQHERTTSMFAQQAVRKYRQSVLDVDAAAAARGHKSKLKRKKHKGKKHKGKRHKGGKHKKAARHKSLMPERRRRKDEDALLEMMVEQPTQHDEEEDAHRHHLKKKRRPRKTADRDHHREKPQQTQPQRKEPTDDEIGDGVSGENRDGDQSTHHRYSRRARSGTLRGNDLAAIQQLRKEHGVATEDGGGGGHDNDDGDTPKERLKLRQPRHDKDADEQQADRPVLEKRRSSTLKKPPKKKRPSLAKHRSSTLRDLPSEEDSADMARAYADAEKRDLARRDERDK